MSGSVFHAQVLFEIMHVLLRIAKINRLFFSFTPTGGFKRSQNKIFITNDVRLVFLEC